MKSQRYLPGSSEILMSRAYEGLGRHLPLLNSEQHSKYRRENDIKYKRASLIRRI